MTAPSRGPVERLGARSVRAVGSLGAFARFGARVLASFARGPFRGRRWLDEIFDAGVRSLAIILVSGLAVGMVLGLQGYNTLVRFGAAESLGVVVGLTLIRELGPVLTALLVTGRAASAQAAEIGSMVATEQLDGLRMMSIDPVHYVVAPKFMGLAVAMPLLSGLFTVMGLLGGYLVGVLLLGVDAGSFLATLESGVDFRDDVVPSFVKAGVFGVVVALIAAFRGFHAAPHSAGVSAATTSTVVIASVTTLVLDYFLTSLLGV